MKNKILTFSVAAFNVQKYLSKLIESIMLVKQLELLELLIVNDGSTDETLSIAKEFEKKYPNVIRVVDKENGGHGSTINIGLCEASGKYFKPLDGDDWVDPTGLNELLSVLQSSNEDIVLTDYFRCYEDGREERITTEGLEANQCYSADVAVKAISRMFYHITYYKTDILQKNYIRLDEHCFFVDTELAIYPVPFFQSVRYVPTAVYCYRLGLEEQSVSKNSRMKHIDDSRKVAYALFSFYKENQEHLSLAKRQYVEKYIASHCVWHFRSLMFFAPSHKQFVELKNFDDDVAVFSKTVFENMSEPVSGISWHDSQIVSRVRKTKYLYYFLYGIARKVLKK